MGIDLMPTAAIDELYRVVKPEGRIFINIEHPSTIDFKLNLLAGNNPSEEVVRQIRRSRRRKKRKSDIIADSFWNHYRETNQNVLKKLEEVGFSPVHVREIDNSEGQWLEFDMVKNVARQSTENSDGILLWVA